MGRISNYSYKLAKNILEKTPTVASFISISLFELGNMTLNSFLSPRYSFTKPTRIFFGMEPKYSSRKIKKNTIRVTLKRLQKLGIVEKRGDTFFLSKFGKNLMAVIKRKNKIIGGKWDGKYRVVIFDIPEKIRKTRDWLRSELYLLEYRKLQKSVFISKKPLTRDIIEAIKNLKINNYVNYLLVDKVFDDRLVRK